MEALVKQIIDACKAFEENASAQIVKGNKAAGARARKNALEIMKAMKDFRKQSVTFNK